MVQQKIADLPIKFKCRLKIDWKGVRKLRDELRVTVDPLTATPQSLNIFNVSLQEKDYLLKGQ